MANTISNEMCQRCAQCCKNFPYIELSQDEIHALEQLTGLAFDVFTNQKDDAGKEFFLQFKKNGDCFFLNEKNGDYSCSVYAARSGICRNYPSKPRQDEVCNAHMEMILRNNSDLRVTAIDQASPAL